MLRKAKLIGRFYRMAMMPFCLCLSVGLICPVITWGISPAPILCLVKLLLYGVIVYFVIDFNRHDFAYYANLDLPRHVLLVWSCAIDYLLFGLLMSFAIFWSRCLD
ncbi:MAG: hypothetical protein RR996_00435 [Alistipes sp.]